MTSHPSKPPATRPSALPPGTSAWVLASGKVGHEVHCIGIARELGLDPLLKQVAPRALFGALSPFGPIDPRDSAKRPGSLLAPPFPDIVFAAGRVTVPYLRHLRRALQHLAAARDAGKLWLSTPGAICQHAVNVAG